ncbi:uncharacterized protein BXZ73DRAFT_89349 [Epithele typhae]|uniref:uncharacterized protein n=1 Tax=Epithele typhae TaxID=378194 RepID=UPI0020085345|nr:uncharacterized protein BXZ73DRAFT_89349 [Epithele typhae]KAH9936896.1 hypothetical protein BXZ73DRAFT_89349 [Epithele typhae]
MLSAVAARKAPGVSTRALSQKPPSKRKPPPRNDFANKRKKDQHRKPSPARYFASPPTPDAFSAQDDLIAVDDADSDSSASSSDVNIGTVNFSSAAPLADSSDEEQDDIAPYAFNHPPHPLNPPPRTKHPLHCPRFGPSSQNVFYLEPNEVSYGDPSLKSTLLLLDPHVSLVVIQGSISLAGVQLFPSSISHPVFAPRSSPIPIIQDSSLVPPPVPPPHSPAYQSGSSASTTAPRFSYKAPHRRSRAGQDLQTFDGVFAPSRWHRSQLWFDLMLDSVYFLPHRTPDVFPFVVPPSWEEAIGSVLPGMAENCATSANRQVYLVKGPKNAGKSSFAKLAVNKLLGRFQRVAYLECDLGQSEFTPGGMVAIHILESPVFGPSFTHPSVPYASHYAGTTSPRTSPSFYLESIQALVQLYHLDVENATLDEDAMSDVDDNGRITSSIPLVVNTMGWTKGLGADLARRVEENVEPSHIFAFDTHRDEELTYPRAAYDGPMNVSLRTLECISLTQQSTTFTAADHRNLNLLSYFHAVFPTSPSTSPYPSLTATKWSTSLPLCAQPPFELDVAAALDRIILSGTGAEDVVPSELPRALPCALVGLVACDPGALDPAPPPPTSLPYIQGAPPPPPHQSRCLGLALVRAVSPSASTPARLHLLTPVSLGGAAPARVLVQGELQLPVWGLLDARTLDGVGGGDVAGVERARVPFLRWGKGEGVGGERRRVRRNLMRRGQM